MTEMTGHKGVPGRADAAPRDAWMRSLLFWVSLPPLLYAAWAGSCVFGYGGWELGWTALILAFHGVLTLAAFPVAFVLVLIPGTRTGGVRLVVAACWSVFACVLALFGGDALRMKGFEYAAERADPLVRAIERFEQERGAPPSTLSALVPGYIDAIPDRLPELTIEVGPKVALGDRWMLHASCASGFLNWDAFIYLPGQQYPKHALGGILQRVGTWAYVHE